MGVSSLMTRATPRWEAMWTRWSANVLKAALSDSLVLRVLDRSMISVWHASPSRPVAVYYFYVHKALRPQRL